MSTKQELLTQISAVLLKKHADDPLRGILPLVPEIAEKYIRDLKLEIRNGKITTHLGQSRNIDDDLEQILDSDLRISLPQKRAGGYVSKFNNPDPDTRKQLSDDMFTVLAELSKSHAIVPKDQEAYDKALRHLANNFLYEYNGNGGEIEFRKLSNEGILGEEKLTFVNLKNVLSHLVDHSKTYLASELKSVEYKRLAKEILGDKAKPERIQQKVEELQQADLSTKVAPSILPLHLRSDVEQEFFRREIVLRRLNESDVSAGTARSVLQGAAKFSYDRLNDLSSIEKELKTINAKEPKKWNGITY